MTISMNVIRIKILLFLCFPLTTTCLQTTAFSQTEKDRMDIPANRQKGKTEQLEIEKKRTVAIAYAGRLLGDKQSTRLLIELDREINFHSFYIDNPPRVVIDMSGTVFRIKDRNMLKPRGLVRGLRYGTMTPGQSRIVVSLANPARISSEEIRRITDERYQFVLDLEKMDINEFRRRITEQKSSIVKNSDETDRKDEISNSGKKAGRLTIVLDPGHGGIDGGANGGNNVLEKDITLAIALLLERELEDSGPFDVHLTRREDHFVSLKKRLQFTKRKKADLFISIHADNLGHKAVRGATVYTLSKAASDKLSKKLAESENRVDLIAGLTENADNQAVENILTDLASREVKRFSIRFAGYVIEAFHDHIRLIKNPHRHAAFRVLKNMESPSILLELGYLSNHKDEELLQSREWRAKLAERLVQAVKLFFANKL